VVDGEECLEDGALRNKATIDLFLAVSELSCVAPFRLL
jgi:hypothetical protein